MYKIALMAFPLAILAIEPTSQFGTLYEIYGTGDFDGDGNLDIVIVDKPTGKYRIGYGNDIGEVQWLSSHYKSGIQGVSGLVIGKILKERADAICLLGAEQNKVVVIDVSDRINPSQPIEIELVSLGPNIGVSIDIEGEDNNKLSDLIVTTIYNDPVPNKISFYRSTGKEFKLIDEIEDPFGTASYLYSWKDPRGKEWLLGVWRNEGKPAKLAVFHLNKQNLQELCSLDELPSNVEIAIIDKGADGLLIAAYELGKDVVDFFNIVYNKGIPELKKVHTVKLDTRIRALCGINANTTCSVWAFLSMDELELKIVSISSDGIVHPLKRLEAKPGDKWFGMIGYRGKLLAFTAEDYAKAAVRYVPLTSEDLKQWYVQEEQQLPSLKEDDRWTLPLIYERIVQTLEKEGIKSEADMKPYTNVIPGTRVQYVMIPVRGGEFWMGSPEDEPRRRSDEGPRRKVKVDPFWIGKFEVTWNEYDLFVYHEDEQRIRQEIGNTSEEANKLADGVTHPTKPYAEMSFGMGKDGYPAIAMTQHAANKYCQWLSAKTGHFYRLPTEAEWEYACRAGTSTAYSFGDDPNLLGEYAWYEQNSDFKYHKVGSKKPNPWGIHDMHGNVWEWCLDQYVPYSQIIDLTDNPYIRPTKPYPIVVRGGSYDDPAEELRSAARRASDPSWKMRDPQLPKSIWWLTDAPWVGFRLVRPLKVPSLEEIGKYWYNEVEFD